MYSAAALSVAFDPITDENADFAAAFWSEHTTDL